MSNWVGKCRNHHVACYEPSSKPLRLPSRIMNVGPDNSTLPTLVFVNQETPVSPYATLSHCWGVHVPFRLLSSNISFLVKGIPVSSLLRTFQDAPVATRRLDLRYLWIDSLCIIQDSISDWQEQSACMAQVYVNSYCNIAAACATDGTQGCFVDRNPDL